MKNALTFVTIAIGILFATAFVWAGGMGGGGHMMDSYGNWQMGPGQRNNYRDQDRSQWRYEERQRDQEAYDRDMRRLDREISRKERALDTETQSKAPDKGKIEKLRHEISDLEHKYDDRRAEFESKWQNDDR